MRPVFPLHHRFTLREFPVGGGYRTADIAEPRSVVAGGSEFLARLREELRESLKQLEPYGWGV